MKRILFTGAGLQKFAVTHLNMALPKIRLLKVRMGFLERLWGSLHDLIFSSLYKRGKEEARVGDTDARGGRQEEKSKEKDG